MPMINKSSLTSLTFLFAFWVIYYFFKTSMVCFYHRFQASECRWTQQQSPMNSLLSCALAILYIHLISPVKT